MVSIKNLSKYFGNKQVLREINLEVPQGEILAIMGSSGGGKTTLLRCISGLMKPTTGDVVVADIDVQKKPDAARKVMGMVFQSAALFDYLNVRDNVLFGVRRQSKLKPAEQKQMVTDTLRLVGLEGSETLMPDQLSGGMKKRVGIARALALQPRVMLYDEPTTGLDPVTSYTIDSLIVDVRKMHQVTSIVVSHDVSSVMRVADRIAFLDKGVLTFVGTPSEFEKSNNAAIMDLVGKAKATTLG
jgi:phospholipid/cholesterol/gamma-HCH transport system ATP-binding protein